MRHLAYLTLTVVVSAAASCEPDPGPPFRARVCLQIHHHGIVPSSATAYVQAGADFPGYGSDMDARYAEAVEMGPTGRLCFDGLGVGPYWFAVEGFDADIRDSVRGSKSLEISTRSAAYDLDVGVSEQH